MREIVGLPLTTDDSSDTASSGSTDYFNGATTTAATAVNVDGITTVLDDGVLLVNNPASVSQVVHNAMRIKICILFKV
jgi:hypothetical protein